MYANRRTASVLVLSLAVLVAPAIALGGKKGGGGGGSSTSSGRFTCRASAARVDQLLGAVVEPTVANPPEDPCLTDNEAFICLAPLASGVTAQVLVASTEDSSAPVTSNGLAVGVDVLGLVSAEVLEATARVDSVGGSCVLSGSSSVASAVVKGTPLTLIEDHLEIPILGVGVVHFNETLGGNAPTSGAPDPNKVTQRALWIEITNPLLQQTTGLEDVIVGEATADFEGGNPCGVRPKSTDKRRMTGGGKFSEGSVAVTHGFILHCNAARSPNNLEVNWGGNRFHLETLASASCSDAPGIDEGKPDAGFDTHTGTGSGRLNGVSGATARWTFIDAGEPGHNDTADLRITDRNGTVILDVQGALLNGNHQAHP